MNYTEYRPLPALGPYVEAFWFVSGAVDAVAAPNLPERVLPDGCIEWIFHLGAPFRRCIDGSWEIQPRSFVVGELTQFILLQPTGPTATLGVRFRPGGAYRFVPVPLNLLTDHTVPTADLWGADGTDLEDAVLAADSDVSRKNLIEHFLVRRLYVTSPRPRFDAAVAAIMYTRGRARVDQLAKRIASSPRQLEREFRASAGLSPKVLARIIRFQNLLQRVGEDQLRDWATLALAGGYADQPHMVREFREFCGQSPTERQAGTAGDLAQHFVSPHRLGALLGAP